MSNYLWYLLTKKQLDVSDPKNPKKQSVHRYFQLILKEGETDNKKKDIQPHYVERLYIVMMA